MATLDLSRRRAIALAMHFQGVSYSGAHSLEQAEDLWVKTLLDQGLTKDQVERVIKVDTDSFEKEILKGEFSDEVSSIADPALLAMKAATPEEIEASRTKRSRASKPQGEAPSQSPKAEAVTESLPVGTRITVQGKSWEGFIATIEGEEGSHYLVATPTKKGSIWRGKIRKSAVMGVIS